ncbi:transcriptional regulator [Corynebacterium sp. 13CS0277]|uniref:ArsR/SmtB family transcription factor n=1 Tax=Corynebacterium sp. 13CS0277 TaxID=2071994 RepID=UPI000D046127|nr:metalloregulator ArsR/SmtB family transcription factor [Corynebacterium sp. 13CS0277]PRQ10456.1 transcriptional regulator [Corynebacterium sp. 13CS0277]
MNHHASGIDAMNRLGRALADPTRSRILLTLLEKPSFPVDIAADLGLTRSNVSNHLTCLRDCGIVSIQPRGRKTLYTIATHEVEDILLHAQRLVLHIDPTCECDAGDKN